MTIAFQYAEYVSRRVRKYEIGIIIAIKISRANRSGEEFEVMARIQVEMPGANIDEHYIIAARISNGRQIEASV
jgi:hypothetical protein